VPNTYLVTNTGDNGGVNPTPGAGTGTLRQAIVDANANPGADAIQFAIGSGVQTIAPSLALPVITGPVSIDGTTQPGYAGTPIIELNGSSAVGSGVNGLTLTGGNSTVRGLVINRFGGVGINLASSNNVVAGNYIGTNVAGTAALGNIGFGMEVSASNNRIGGTTSSERNIISANNHGIRLIGTGVTGNLVQGNYIGTDVTGTIRLGNAIRGVLIQGAPNNTIGGAIAGAGNIISGSGENGIYIFGSAATGNVVQGNLIGTDVTGTVDLGNLQDGVRIDSGSNNIIGGTTPAARNVISGNDSDGVEIRNGATGNVVQGNYIGMKASGTSALGNNGDGVHIFGGAKNNRIGINGDGVADAAERNIISANAFVGVRIAGTGSGAHDNVVAGNFIGTDVTGTAALGNQEAGLWTIPFNSK
jgi:titin